MRTIKIFFLSLLGFSLLLLAAIFIGREFLLLSANSSLKASYKILSKGAYSNKCFEEFGRTQDYWTQLRFTSSRDYNLEVVCEDFANQPIVLEEAKLPMFVNKISNTSGLVMDDKNFPTYIDVHSLGRKKTFYIEDKNFHATYLKKPNLDYDIGPDSQCQAFNKQCCSLDLQSGQGEGVSSATDCPKSCYESCLVRPVILSFNSRPVFDDSRVVAVRSGEEITFSYVVGDRQKDVFAGQIAKEEEISLVDKVQLLFSEEKEKTISDQAVAPIDVTVDFGDGEVFTSQNLQDTLDHVYTCNSRICYFETRIKAIDAKKSESITNELSKIIVRVTNL